MNRQRELDTQAKETATQDELDEEQEQEDEPFEPFTCRKCGKLVLNPWEPCSVLG